MNGAGFRAVPLLSHCRNNDRMKLHVKLVLLLAGLSLGPGAAGQQVVHAAPSGTAEGDGSQETPVSLLRAVELVKPGDRIILAGGEYLLPRRIEIYRSGEPGRPIRMEAAPGATPVLDGRNIAEGGEWSRSVVSLKADYWHFTGIHFVNGWSGGVTLSGSHNRFDRCVAHHNGGTG